MIETRLGPIIKPEKTGMVLTALKCHLWWWRGSYHVVRSAAGDRLQQLWRPSNIHTTHLLATRKWIGSNFSEKVDPRVPHLFQGWYNPRRGDLLENLVLFPWWNYWLWTVYVVLMCTLLSYLENWINGWLAICLFIAIVCLYLLHWIIMMGNDHPGSKMNLSCHPSSSSA